MHRTEGPLKRKLAYFRYRVRFSISVRDTNKIRIMVKIRIKIKIVMNECIATGLSHNADADG